MFFHENIFLEDRGHSPIWGISPGGDEWFGVPSRSAYPFGAHYLLMEGSFIKTLRGSATLDLLGDCLQV